MDNVTSFRPCRATPTQATPCGRTASRELPPGLQHSNVVDVGNLTLELDVMRKLMELRRSYAAILTCTANKKAASINYDGGTDDWLRDGHTLRDMKLIMKTAKFNTKGSADSGPHIVRGILNFQPENAGKTLGKPRVFSQLDVGAISLLCEPRFCEL